MFILNPHSGTPIYRQLVDQVRRLVASGELKAGAPLPSVRDLAAEHAVNRMTVSKAYSLLENEGLVQRHRGKPMTVVGLGKRQTALPRRVEQVRDQTQDLVLAAKQLQLRKRDVVELLSTLWEEE